MTIENAVQGSTTVLQVTIKNPQSFIFQGKAIAVSCINDTGPFDVLPLHSNFISLIKNYILLYESKTKIRKVQFEQGIIKVFENNVDIFLGIQMVS